MKKFLVLLAVLAILPAASAMADPIAVGNQVVVNYWTGADRYIEGTHGGGPFGVFTTGGAFLFPTMCVETTETFSPGTTYTITRIDTKIIEAGIDDSYLALPPQVAWLYAQFRGLTEANQMSQGDDYQAAIWWYVTVGHSVGQYNSLAADASTHTSGIGDVRVLGFDLADPAGGEAVRIQDFLTLQPIPEPGSMLLLGTGLIGLAGAVRRRMRK